MHFKWQKHFGLQKAAAATVALLVALVHSVCTAAASAAQQPVEVTASLPMVGEWIKAVGGEHVHVRVVSPDGADPHTFEPSVRNIQAVNRSRVLFVIGMGLEPWAERLMRADPSLNVVQIAPAVSALRRIDAGHDHSDADDHASHHGHSHATEHVHASHHGHSHGTEHTHAHTADCAHGEFDPHVWLDPLRVKEMVGAIEGALILLAPQNADDFSRNADAYRGKLDALHEEIVLVLAPIEPQRRKLVTNHDNLYYFAERYNFVVLDTLFGAQGVSGGQPSARRVREIVTRIKANDVEALFADASSSRSLLEAVAAEAGMPTPRSFYSIPAGSASPAPDYLQMMRHNASEIASAFIASTTP